MGEGVCAIPDLRAVGSALLRPARGPVRAAAAIASPLDCPRGPWGYQVMSRPPVGSATCSNRCCALPHRAAPRGPHVLMPACQLLVVRCSATAPPWGCAVLPVCGRREQALRVQHGHARAWQIWCGLAHTLGVRHPQTPARPQRSVGRMVFYCRAVCRGSGRRGRLPMAGEASRVGASSGAAPLACGWPLRFFLLEGDAMYAPLAPASRPGSFRSSVAPVVLRSASQP